MRIMRNTIPGSSSGPSRVIHQLHLALQKLAERTDKTKGYPIPSRGQPKVACHSVENCKLFVIRPTSWPRDQSLQTGIRRETSHTRPLTFFKFLAAGARVFEKRTYCIHEHMSRVHNVVIGTHGLYQSYIRADSQTTVV